MKSRERDFWILVSQLEAKINCSPKFHVTHVTHLQPTYLSETKTIYMHAYILQRSTPVSPGTKTHTHETYKNDQKTTGLALH